jgi:type VI secretion system protein ImpH
MATTGGGAAPPVKPNAPPVAGGKVTGPAPPLPNGPANRPATPPRVLTVEEHLFAEPYAYDFFQAVRLLEALDPKRVPVGRGGPPAAEVCRFRAHASLSFPPSPIYDLERPTPARPFPVMTVAFFGLTGPSGVLPRHYTEMLVRLEKESKSGEKSALRDWFDLFNHRFIALFFRAWEKYRFWVPYLRGEYDRPEPDPFTLCLLSFVGLGMPPLRNRLRVALWQDDRDQGQERALARIDDLALLHYSGFLAHRPRNALSLEALLKDYFELPARVQQFRGQWLRLEPANRSRFEADGNNLLGVNLVAGERVWDVQSKVRIRLGPLRYGQFLEFLPDRAGVPARKAFYLLSHLVRMYVGPELDFDVQLVLAAADVPPLQLAPEGAGPGPRLGWNTWLVSRTPERDADDAAFEGEEIFWLNPEERARFLAVTD